MYVNLGANVSRETLANMYRFKTAGDFTICLGKVVKFDRFRESLSELGCDCIVDPIG